MQKSKANPVVINPLKDHLINKTGIKRPVRYSESSEQYRSELKYNREFNSSKWGC
jgi:hypothetical protein